MVLINSLAVSMISIHSTTRVETNKHFPQPFNRHNFNPLHHEGGDTEALLPDPKFRTFQSTPPRGWRPAAGVGITNGMIFQSTPPRGWRPESRKRKCSRWEFQSTPPRGWRHADPKQMLAEVEISIHSTTRVETAILHNNHYYSSTHFHKQIISHPLKSRPTIPAHSQIRSHCANFPVRISP